jgi:hypothetical protein
MTKKSKDEVIPVSQELQKNIDVILSIKSEVDKLGNNCLQIKVVDETTLSVAQQNLSSATQLIKSIEEKRKKIKDPYLKAGKLIDSTCNDLVEIAEKGIAHIKEEIKGWDARIKEEQTKAQLELEKRLEEERVAREQDNARRSQIRQYIDTKLIPFLIDLYEKADSAFACDKSIDYIDQNFPNSARFEEFWEEACGHKDNYVNLLKTKKSQFMSADSMSETEKELIKQKQELALQKAEIAKRESELKAKEEEVKNEAIRKEAEDRAEVERMRLLAESEMSKTKGVREILRFELVDKSKLIEEWITLDDAKVKEYIKSNQVGEGVINGVRFYFEKSVRA